MESLSRKHSRNPYDDVFLSNGAGRETLDAHEYAEIFSGSSSIPVLDLSGLNERVGSGLPRTSKLDYSDIFGGLRNEDVGFPGEERFSSSAEKAQSQNPTDERVLSQESDSLHSAGNSTDERVLSQESDSLHSAGNPKIPVGEASDNSTDELKKQFNVSFNRTHQKNIDTSNGKTHVAQLQAVPGFTHFVDGTPHLLKTYNGRTANSLKHEVSRTWSFNAEAETIKGKSGLSRDKSHIPDNKLQPRASYFVPKNDASENNAGEFSPPFYGEDFDENSIAAASAAALKRAIDQAQESIRLAKMIMDRKKEGYQNGSKTRQRRHPKVSYREGEMDRDSKKNNFKDKNAEVDPTTFDGGIDGKSTPSLIHNDAFISAAKIEVESVCENAAEDKGHGTVLSGEGELFSSNGIQRESIYIDEKIELKRTEENVEVVEAPSEGADFPVLLANECKTANLEHRDVSVDHAQGAEVVAEQVERALDTSFQRIQELEINVEDAGDFQATFDHAKGPEYKVERALNTPQRTRRQWKVFGGACEFFGIGQEDRLSEERENDMDDMGKKEPVEVINVECITELRSEPDSIIDESCNLGGNEALGQVETEREPERKENSYIFKTYDDKANLCWKGPEYKVERVLNTPQRTRRQWKVFGGACEFSGIGQEDRLSEERKNDMDDKGKKEPVEVINVECVTELRSEPDSIINESCNLGGNEALGRRVETEREPERKENGYIFKTYDDKANLWSESEEQLMEALEKESEQLTYERNVILEIEEGEKRVDEAHEPEIDNQRENAYDEDEQNLPEEVEQSEVEERRTNTSECEVPDTIETGEKHFAQVQKSADFFDIEENRSNSQNEDDAYEEHINEAVDMNTSSSSTIFSETRDACNVDLDNTPKECQTVVENPKENYTLPEVIETYSEISKDKEAEHLFHQEKDNEIPGTETLHRTSSEEISVESELHNDFDSLSSDGSSKIENVGVMGEDPEEELPEDEGASNTSEIHDVEKDFMSEIDLPHVHSSDNRTSEFDPEDVEQVSEASGSDEGSVSTSSHENINGFSAHDSEECEENANDMTPINEELRDEVDLVSNERKLAEGKFMEREGAGEGDPKTENNKGDLAGTSPTEEKDVKVGDPQNSDKNDSQQRIDAIKRGREREKDRKVVERAIREARERAFTEARERAERAAVEKATAEARQRAMSQAWEKASTVKQPVVVDKASTQAKLRAERAAVERATAEARERALEKAMSLKATHTEGRTPEKVSRSSRSNGLKHSFSSSDLDLDNGTESAQRRKARLERHHRIMERAANALAEKNMRDVLAQKEQAERNRLAESLDADIKRWATGKEKNLRALLSTLQYILGADSGWQPIPLTDIVTTAAVKKAYRKATLCVHPDKLQQRGATIKQKYICEKVFDLLKAAWSRYDSDER